MMTEAEWSASSDPTAMLRFATWEDWQLPGECQVRRASLSDRKLRLFACACCHQVWHLLTDDRSRQAVVWGELYADEMASQIELADRWGAANDANRPDQGGYTSASVVAATCAARPQDLANTLPRWVGYGSAAQANLLRDIIGNPWRPVVRVSWVSPEAKENAPPYLLVAWFTPDVLACAHAAYDHRQDDGTLDPVRLSVLADALEEAGCTEAMLLDHCRQPGEHVRGCWALDLLLGKN